jgi:hypothetical protein
LDFFSIAFSGEERLLVSHEGHFCINTVANGKKANVETSGGASHHLYLNEAACFKSHHRRLFGPWFFRRGQWWFTLSSLFAGESPL